jgi:predicted Zn-dependent peptidase
MSRRRWALAGCALALVACAAGPDPVLVHPSPSPDPSGSAPLASASAAPDPLGPRPLPPEPAPFSPPGAEVLAGPGGSKIWLLERHGLPLVSVELLVPTGSTAEPADRAGLAHVSADMVDEGAGSLDSMAFSRAIEDLGAQFSSAASRDRSAVTLEVLPSKLAEGLSLLGDAILRPRHDKDAWKRVSALWKNEIRSRGDSPNEVARLVTSAALFGVDQPYGRPIEGTRSSSARVDLADVARWHRSIWRPDRAIFIVVGDVSKERITTELSRAFASWSAPATAAPEPPAVAAPPAAPRTVLVDRPDAPQIVLTVARPGVTASSPDMPGLDLMNVALGGSFTSRLNQNLREDHGWTYGARTQFIGYRQGGVFLARAAIRTDALSDALRETLKEINTVQREGLGDEELGKIKALARASAIEAYGSLRGISVSLAQSATMGLPPDTDRRALGAQLAATRPDIAALASKYLALEGASIILVGPRKAIEAALEANKLPPAEERDVEGRPVTEASAPKPGKGGKGPKGGR